jgi:peptidoglycan hydrolase-like protein with peptidoglycan-binding domain
MTVRTFLLYGVLLVVGAGAFHDALDTQERRRQRLQKRRNRLEARVAGVKELNRRLRTEIVALQNDRYYVERLARAELGWRPVKAQGADGIDAEGPDSLLADGLPSLNPTFPSPIPPVGGEAATPAEPQLSSEQRGTRALAALGYRSLEDFQRKMVEGRPSRRFDEETVRRAEELVAMVQGLGFDTVEALQRRYRMKADGILGPKTERVAAQALARVGLEGRGQQALAALGYPSLEHFQRKMLHGPPSGRMDERTVARAEKLVALVGDLGFESVKAFQQKHGLKPDGVLGRRTEAMATRVAARTARPARARQALAALGYTSVDHFQRKMMGGRPTGRLDEATQKRAIELAGMIRALGFASVKEFQARNGLAPDGIFGRRTEQRATKLLRSRGRTLRTSASIALSRPRRPGEPG